MCRKNVVSGSLVLRHEQMAVKCHPVIPGWCFRYEGGGPRGVDAAASPAFYPPDPNFIADGRGVLPLGTALWSPIEYFSAPEEVQRKFRKMKYPFSVSTY